MLKYLLVLLLLPTAAHAQFGSGGTGFGTDIQFKIDNGTFSLTGTWDFSQSNVTLSTGATSVLVNAPLTGDGLPGTELGVDSSSVTLKGNTFNIADQLLQLDSSGDLPALDGSNLTGISAIITQRTTAQLQSDNCGTHPVTQCIRHNATDFDLYTSTGSLAGQWRNTRLGTGPGATP